jgi:hypothetical protein
VSRCLRFEDSIIFGPRDIYLEHVSPRGTQCGTVARLLPNSAVFVSENDSIIPSRDVAEYCQATGISCHVMEGLDHSGVLLSWPWLKRVGRAVDEVAKIADVQFSKKTSSGVDS